MPNPLRSDGSIDPFALFCALHLGIGPDDNYQPMGVPGVARRFGVEPRRVRESLREYALDTDTIRNLAFEMKMARLDTKVVPDGISRTEQARVHWEAFLEAAGGLRDWENILNVQNPEDDFDEDEDEDDDSFDLDDEDEDEDEDDNEEEASAAEDSGAEERQDDRRSRPSSRRRRRPSKSAAEVEAEA